MLVFCVGPIFLLPLDLAMVLIAYRHVFPADDDEALYGEREPLPDDDLPQALPAPSEGINTSTPKPKASPSGISGVNRHSRSPGSARHCGDWRRDLFDLDLASSVEAAEVKPPLCVRLVYGNGHAGGCLP